MTGGCRRGRSERGLLPAQGGAAAVSKPKTTFFGTAISPWRNACLVFRCGTCRPNGAWGSFLLCFFSWRRPLCFSCIGRFTAKLWKRRLPRSTRPLRNATWSSSTGTSISPCSRAASRKRSSKSKKEENGRRENSARFRKRCSKSCSPPSNRKRRGKTKSKRPLRSRRKRKLLRARGRRSFPKKCASPLPRPCNGSAPKSRGAGRGRHAVQACAA